MIIFIFYNNDNRIRKKYFLLHSIYLYKFYCCNYDIYITSIIPILLYLYIFRTSKPAPLITETYTNTIEEMIMKRITDEQYDDVIPKDNDQNLNDFEDDGTGKC